MSKLPPMLPLHLDMYKIGRKASVEKAGRSSVGRAG
jgi:hypothetical protein